MAVGSLRRGIQRRRTRLRDEGQMEKEKGREALQKKGDKGTVNKTGRGVARVKRVKIPGACECAAGWARRTGGEEGRDGGKKGNERSRAHPLRATPLSHNPLLLA